MAVRPAGAFTAMSNVLDQSIQQQVVALGRLGWSLRRIEAATGVRRETISGYLKAAGIAVRRRGGRPGLWPPANPATTAPVSTDPGTTPGTIASPTKVLRPRPAGPGVRIKRFIPASLQATDADACS